MRFLGITETCDLGSLYMRLLAEGHEVKVFVEEEGARGTMAGLVPRTGDWRSELDWVGRDGIILFEAVSEGYGALQDRLRAQGYRVVGGSAFGDRLENDRAFAQALLAGLGLRIAAVHDFDTAAAGTPSRRTSRPLRAQVQRPRFRLSDNYVGQLPDGATSGNARRPLPGSGAASPRPTSSWSMSTGVEMGVGAYFDGERFLRPPASTGSISASSPATWAS
jgi:phosphoribosylamine--glycine ligase